MTVVVMIMMMFQVWIVSLSSDDDDDAPNQLKNAFDVVKKAWKSLSPPNREVDIQGKW